MENLHSKTFKGNMLSFFKKNWGFSYRFFFFFFLTMKKDLKKGTIILCVIIFLHQNKAMKNMSMSRTEILSHDPSTFAIGVPKDAKILRTCKIYIKKNNSV